ncbi:MAG: alpha/beta hydrolase, partial [Eubacteriales bacterium]|nr:alpha/beta hydrolase [Eubacteriales bacterium]
MNLLKGAAALVGTAIAAEAGTAAYFYRRTMKRGKAKTERTIKMSGTDWGQYKPFLGERKEYMMAQYHEDVYVTSIDGLKLHGVYFPGEDKGRVVI